MTAFKPDSAVYASFEGPATVDAMLDLAEAKGVVIPLEDLLCTHPRAGLGASAEGHLRRTALHGR